MKSGRVAVIGRANAGKSTFINVAVGEKVSIVSPKPQTTRDRILAVYNGEGCQIVFEDTPGIYKASTLLNSRMQRATETAAKDVDLILFLIDAHERLNEEDERLCEKYAHNGVPIVIALTKADIAKPEAVINAVSKIGTALPDAEIVSLSSRTGKNVDKLIAIIKSLLPDGEPLFSDNVISDKSEKFMLAEIMREKILLEYRKEIPHGVAVTINSFEKRNNGSFYVNLDIVCEKDNHKGIIIGKNGDALKNTAAFAREGMEKFLGGKVFLETFVKVKEDWRDRPDRLREYGYSEEEFK